MVKQKIGIENILPYAMIIGIAIIGISILASVISTVSDNALTWGGSDTITADYDTAVSLSNNYLTETNSVTCGSNSLTLNTDYTEDLDAGTITILSYPQSVLNGTFDSDYDANVTTNSGMFANASSITVHNCTDFTEVWADTTDYIFYENDANITILSTGDMNDAEAYCLNYTFAEAQDGGTCSVVYTYAGEGKAIAEDGLTALGQFGNWWTVMIVVVIAVIIIGVLLMLAKSRGM